MDADIIRSYLVSAGFTVDQPQLKKFEGALNQAGGTVKGMTSGILLDFFKWQTGIVGAFATVSGTIVGMADKAAMADQRYRLMGERMFMTTEQARKTSIALDTLGASMEEVAWDPELHQRFLQLIGDQERLGKMLGPDYEKQMRQMRDIRFEMSRVEVVGEYIGMKFLQDVFKGMGLGDGSVLEQLQRGVEWLTQHGPELAQTLSDTAVPVLKDTWGMLKQVGEMGLYAGQEFTNLVGIIAGDDTLTKEKVTFEDFAHAVEHVVHWLAEAVHLVFELEKVGGAGVDFMVTGARSLGLNLSQGQIDQYTDRQTRDGQKAWQAIKNMGSILTGQSSYDGKQGSMWGGGGGSQPAPTPHPTSGGVSTDDARRAAALVAQKTGLSADLILAQWMHETGGLTNRGARELHNLGGIRLPGTTTYQNFASVEDYANAYAHLITGKRFGAGIRAARTPEEWAHALKHGSDGLAYYEGPEAAYGADMRRWMGSAARGYAGASRPGPGAAGGTIQVQVDQVNIAGTNATPREIASAVGDGVRDRLGKMTQRDLAQLQGVYSY